jgi:hypothetical protein
VGSTASVGADELAAEAGAAGFFTRVA